MPAVKGRLRRQRQRRARAHRVRRGARNKIRTSIVQGVHVRARNHPVVLRRGHERRSRELRCMVQRAVHVETRNAQRLDPYRERALSYKAARRDTLPAPGPWSTLIVPREARSALREAGSSRPGSDADQAPGCPPARGAEAAIVGVAGITAPENRDPSSARTLIGVDRPDAWSSGWPSAVHPFRRCADDGSDRVGDLLGAGACGGLGLTTRS